MKGRDLSDFLPLMPIADPDSDCVISKRGDITFGWQLWLPVAYTVNEAGYDAIISSFMQAYRLLPVYCVVHKQDIYRYDRYHAKNRGEFLMDCYEKHFEGRKYLNGYCYIYLTFSSKAVLELDSSSSGFFRMFQAQAPKAVEIQRCSEIASQFEAVLKNNSLLVLEPLKARDFVYMDDKGRDCGVLPDYLNLYSDEGEPDYPFEFYNSYMMYGDNIVKAWYIEDSDSYPGTVSSVNRVDVMSTGHSSVFLSGGSAIGYELKIPHVVNRYVLTLPRKSVEQELEKKKRLMTSFSLYSAGCRVNAQEISEYLDVAARDNTTTVKCFTDVIAWGAPDKIGDVRNSIVSAFASLGMKVCEETRMMPVLHYAGIPGAAAELGYDYYMNSEITAFLCHGLWDGYDDGIGGGLVKVNDRHRMIPLLIDFQTVARDYGLNSDLNCLVIGPSGSGKSFTMNHLVNNLYVAGQHGLVIDIGDSYQGLFRVINEETDGRDGIYNTYDPDNPLCFNPFRGRQHWNEVGEDGERISSGFDYVISLLETMYEPVGGWTKERTGILENLLLDFFRLWDNGYDSELSDRLVEAFMNGQLQRAEKSHRRFDEEMVRCSFLNPLPDVFNVQKRGSDPVFDDFYQFVTLIVAPLVADENYKIDNSLLRKDMFDVDAFGVAISKYRRDGLYGFLLNASEEKDLFSSRLTCYEVDRIKDNKDLFPLWLLSIMHSFEDKMRTLDCAKYIIIEEAWSAIAKPTMANFIVWLWRTARKFRTSAIVVTQSVYDLTASPIIKDAIINNTSTKILLDQSKNANRFADSANLLALDPMGVGQVLSINKNRDPRYLYKEAFIAIGEHYSNVFGIEVSPEQALVYESEKVKKKPLFDLAERKGSFIDAVREMAQVIRDK